MSMSFLITDQLLNLKETIQKLEVLPNKVVL